MRPVLPVLCAFVLSVIGTRILIPWLHALKAGQSIREVGPKWHSGKSGTPTMGGIAFIAATTLCAVGFGIPSMQEGNFDFLYVLGFGLVYGLIGFVDDFIKVKKKHNEGLTALQKLVLQLAAALAYLLLLRSSGNLTCDLYIPFFQVAPGVNTVVYMIFAAFVIVGCVNAVNLTDGIDGLAAGVTIPVMVFFTVTAVLWKKMSLMPVPAALAGALAGFLVFNFHPAKVFMGDTGSLYLGAMVCGLAFALDMPMVLLLVGLVYIVETLSVIIQVTYFKLTHGKRVFKMTPIHHHFEMCGWSEIKIFTVFTAVSAVLCLAAWLGVQGRF